MDYNEMVEQHRSIVENISAGREIIFPIGIAASIANPVVNPPWIISNLDNLDSTVSSRLLEKVFCAIRKGNFNELPSHSVVESISYHAKRIAFLTRKDSWYDPVVVDSDAHLSNDHPFIDGNHRLYAAIIRGDKNIKVNFVGNTENIIDIVEEIFKEAENLIGNKIYEDKMSISV